MSKSFRKTSIIGICANSDKKAKRNANRNLRRCTNIILNSQVDIEILPDLKEVSDTWGMPKDGKLYFSSKENPELMRK